VHDTRDGFTEIHRQFTGSGYSSTLRDAILKKFGRIAFDLAFVITICPDINDVDDARMNFMLIPEFCVRIRLWDVSRYVRYTLPCPDVPTYCDALS
jgi:hypothetical protein